MSFSRSDGGICASRGFQAAGVAARIKGSGKKDLALIVSEVPAAAAGVFTQNRAAAAPVIVSRDRVNQGEAQAIVINSGCANACTGERGHQDAIDMCSIAAKALSVPSDLVLVCSTGLIGSFLPMEDVTSGIQDAAESLGPSDDGAAAAILTTDKTPKKSAVVHEQGWSLGGIAKGAGMIAPNMATMLAVLTTDAKVPDRVLQAILGEVVHVTFNRITIDGDTSTNDSVIALANGRSGLSPADEDLAAAITTVCRSLAEQIILDGEGATKFVRVRVRGASSDSDAVRAARVIAESTLVKAALWGADPNWGRIAAALGRSGALFDLANLSISVAGITLLDRGSAAPAGVVAQAHAAMRSSEIVITCDLYVGEDSAEILTTDLSPDYVSFNADYPT